MGATTLTSVPAFLHAGDTLLMNISLADYSAADSWTLSYHFRAKDATAIDITGSANGADHLFNVATGTTGGWTPAVYTGKGVVTNGTQVFTVWEGRLEILPEFAQQGDNYDTRSHAKKALDSINLVLEGKAGRDVLSSTIAGQTISRMSFTELMTAKSYYQNIVDAEEDALNGNNASRTIKVRFVAP